MPPAVFIDTNIFKFSATALRRYAKGHEQELQWGPLQLHVPVYSELSVNPNEGIENPVLRAEADLLPVTARLGINGQVRFVLSAEGRYEMWGLPNLDSDSGLFYGASVETISAPFDYSRVIGGLGIDGADEQYRFLAGLQDKRFLEFQKATGAYQGSRPRQRNQLLDAFHLWCAEAADCEFFLTLDLKLLRVISSAKLVSSLRLVKPSELLREFDQI